MTEDTRVESGDTLIFSEAGDRETRVEFIAPHNRWSSIVRFPDGKDYLVSNDALTKAQGEGDDRAE